MKIRVLHCIETIASGGVEQVRLTLVGGLNPDNFEHKIICTWAGGPIAEALQEKGVELISIGGFKHPFELNKHKRVLQIIRQYKPHIIHGAIFEGMTMAAINGTIGSVPVIILEETSDPTTRSKKAIYFQRILVGLSDKIIGISPKVCDFLEKNVGIPQKKIKLVNNGVVIPNERKISKSVEISRNELNFESSNFIIGAIGRVFDDVKRFSDILLAIKKMGGHNVALLLVGDGPDLDKIKNLANELGLGGLLISVGYQSNTSVYYSAMDILCVPSAHEGFGLVAVEAMLHRLPVIATKVGGLQDIVIDKETGFLVPPYSPELIAEKIQYLIDHPETRKTMGEKGYQRAMEHYTAERYCKEVEDLYLELLKKKGIIN